MNNTKPFLLGITLYSVLILQMVLLSAITVLVFLKSEMEELQSFIHTDISNMQSHSFLYFITFLLIVSIYSVIQMLRRKKHGIYVFSIFSVIISIIILLGKPIEFLNIFMLGIMNYIFYMYHSWFNKNTETIDIEKDHTSETS